jgi:hypothetical protein
MRVYPEGYNVISDLRGRVALAHRLRAAGDLAPTNDSTGAFLEQLLTHIDTLTAERDAARERSKYWKAEHAAANEVIDTLRADRDRLAACVERVRECGRVRVVEATDDGDIEEWADDHGDYFRAADILAALEGTNG